MILPMFSAGCVLSGAWNFRSAPQCFWPMHMYSLAYLSSLTAIWSDWSHIMQCFNSSCHGILKMNPSITQLLPNPQLAQPVVPIQPTKPFHNSACVHQVAKALCLYSRPRLGPNHRIVYQLRTAAGTQASVFGAGSDMDALASVFPKLMHSRRGPKQLKSHFIPIWEQAKCNFSRLQRQLKRSLFRHCCRGRTVKGQVQSAPNFRVASFLLWATFLVFHRERFWGSGHNCEIVRRIVLSYVRLRKFESLNVAEYAQSFRIRDLKWLGDGPVSNQNQRENRLHGLVDFLAFYLRSFITELIRTCFFVTDSQQSGTLLYHPHHVWLSFAQSQIRNRLAHWTPLSPYMDRLSSTDPSFTHRIMPKDIGSRLITRRRDFNRVAPLPVAALKALLRAKDSVSWSKWDTVFRPLRSFLRLNQNRHMCFLACDVMTAFDSLQPQHISALLAKHFVHEIALYEYEVPAQSGSADSRRFKHYTTVPLDRAVMKRKKATFKRLRIIQPHIIVSSILAHLSSISINVDKTRYGPFGLPQGFALSPLLCDLFFSGIQNTISDQLQHFNHTIVRWVDDWLFISTEPLALNQFHLLLQSCLHQVDINLKGKPLANIHNDMMIYSQEIPWCGLRFLSTRVALSLSLDLKPRNVMEPSHHFQNAQPSRMLFGMRRMLSKHLHTLVLDSSYLPIGIIHRNFASICTYVAVRMSISLKYFQWYRGNVHAHMIIGVINKLASSIPCGLDNSFNCQQSVGLMKDILLMAFQQVFAQSHPDIAILLGKCNKDNNFVLFNDPLTRSLIQLVL